MMWGLSQKLKALFSRTGAVSADATKDSTLGSRFYTDSELASIQQHRMRANKAAREVVRKHVTIDPRIAAARAKRQGVPA